MKTNHFNIFPLIEVLMKNCEGEGLGRQTQNIDHDHLIDQYRFLLMTK